MLRLMIVFLSRSLRIVGGDLYLKHNFYLFMYLITIDDDMVVIRVCCRNL